MKIGVVGAGFVGATAAYALVMRGIGSELVLIDKSDARAQAEADDIFHAVPFAHQVRVSAGSYRDLEGAQIVILAAGVNQQPGETRLQLLSRNASIFREIVPEVLRNTPNAILVVATNPVDVMTHLTAKIAADYGVPDGRVLGSGTMLDTARFRALLGRHLGVDPAHIHAYVVGEHGDSEVLTWSLAAVGGLPLDYFCEQRGILLDEQARAVMDDNVRRAAYHIISGKRATYYGIGSALARIAEVIAGNRRAILTVCKPMPEIAGVPDVTVALPHLVSGEGVVDTFPLELSKNEQELLHKSASLIKEVIVALDS